MAARSYIRKLVKVNQQELHRTIETESGVIRCGPAVDCNIRAKQYEHEGFSGIMYYAESCFIESHVWWEVMFYARTKNMKKLKTVCWKLKKGTKIAFTIFSGFQMRNKSRVSSKSLKEEGCFRNSLLFQCYSCPFLNCFNKAITTYLKLKLFTFSDEYLLVEYFYW